MFGRSEPGATARVEWEGGARRAQVGPETALFRILPPLPAGDHLITIAVRDAAGNTTSSRRHLRFDDEAPVLPEPVWPTIEKKTDSPVLRGPGVRQPEARSSTITINGETVKPKMTPTGFRIETHGLAQGMQTIDVTRHATGPATPSRTRSSSWSTRPRS